MFPPTRHHRAMKTAKGRGGRTNLLSRLHGKIERGQRVDRGVKGEEREVAPCRAGFHLEEQGAGQSTLLRFLRGHVELLTSHCERAKLKVEVEGRGSREEERGEEGLTFYSHLAIELRLA